MNPSSPTLLCWINVRLEHILWWAEQHDLFGEYVPCWIHVQAHRNRQTLTSQDVDSIKRWCPSWLMPPDMTHMNLILIHYGIHESPGDSDSWPRHQDLCPINTQTTRVWSNLHNAATWLIRALAYRFEIDPHDFRTTSEPMLSFILEDLHDGITKTK